jgi:hypothetical protein
MGKYSDSQSHIFSVFALSAWQAENVKTIPQDMIALNLGDEFIRVSIVTGSIGANRKSTKGVCIIDIYTAHGKGPLDCNRIADKLDVYLQDKSISTSGTALVQFGQSTLVPKGQDKDNSRLTRSSYTIPFSFFGTP